MIVSRENEHINQSQKPILPQDELGIPSFEEAMAAFEEDEQKVGEALPKPFLQGLRAESLSREYPVSHFDSLCYLAMDGEASPEEHQVLQALCEGDPLLASRCAELAQLSLLPDETITFPSKNRLKHPVIVFAQPQWLRGLAAAAVVLLALLTGWIYRDQLQLRGYGGGFENAAQTPPANERSSMLEWGIREREASQLAGLSTLRYCWVEEGVLPAECELKRRGRAQMPPAPQASVAESDKPEPIQLTPKILEPKFPEELLVPSTQGIQIALIPVEYRRVDWDSVEYAETMQLIALMEMRDAEMARQYDALQLKGAEGAVAQNVRTLGIAIVNKLAHTSLASR